MLNSKHGFNVFLFASRLTCSYHQKYLLRKHDWLVSALDLQDDNKMISSSVAARINGYIGGYGDEVSFESERTLLNLNDEVYDYVLEEIRSKAR